jgi:capsular polysaccharide biosynthesis protein
MIDEGVAPPLRDYVDVLWRRKKAIIGITAIVVGLSLWYASQKTPIYHSSAEVLVRPIRLSPTDTSTTFVDINTEQQVAQSSAVIDLAKNDLGASQIGSLSVKNILNTNTLQFTSSSTNARVAQRSADAYANAYLEFRRQGVVDDLQAASQPMNQRIQQLAQQINGVQAELARTKDPTQVTSLQIQLTSLLTQKTTLEGQLNNLILPEELRVGTVLQAAILPTRPSSLGLARVGILGLLMGLALGTGVALMRERLDDRVRDREHLEALAGAPVLAVVPRLRSWRRNGVGLSILTKPDSEIAEAYKSLRTSFMFAASQRGAKTVMVTSCNPDEGKTTTIANLGLALARGGKHVALVSGDLRRPQLDRYLSVRAEAGLTRVLTGECDLLDAMVWADENLWFIGAGPPPGNPADLLGSDRQRCDACRRRHDCPRTAGRRSFVAGRRRAHPTEGNRRGDVSARSRRCSPTRCGTEQIRPVPDQHLSALWSVQNSTQRADGLVIDARRSSAAELAS